MKKYKKVFTILIVLTALILIQNTKCFAASSFGDVINGGSSFINEGLNTNTIVPTQDTIKNTSNLIFNVLSIMGIIVLVVWGMVLGIKFITGSIEEKAEVKKGLIAYGVGCIIIFGGYTIWAIVVNIASQLG